jgi:3-oxoacyl-[acyl-carrier-protein] synthase III
MPDIHAFIRSVGRYLPERRLTNQDLEKIVDTTDEWIFTRTGIRERRILGPGLGNSFMAIRAALDCLERGRTTPAEVDAIIVGTVTPDMFFPATACLVQEGIGATHAWGFDLSAGCSGFIYALTAGVQMIESGRHQKVLVIGSDVISTVVDYEDRNTCVLFGDAAGAVLLEPCPDEGYGILDYIHFIDGAGGEHLQMKAGGSRRPASLETIERKEHYVYQEGRQLFKSAVTGMADVSVRILEKNGLTAEDVTFFLPHQANLRIIEASANRMGIDLNKVVMNIDRYANTVAATIPLCLYDVVVEEKRVAKGDYLVMSAFGAGYTWGSVLSRWWE